MYKLLIGALLMATTTLAQTGTQGTQTAAQPKKAGVAVRPTGSTESTTRSKSSGAAPSRPFPQPSLKEKLESGNTNVPTYKKEKDAGIHKNPNRYTPRRTDSGARKDTMRNTKL